jgi:putative restriction endonuclease
MADISAYVKILSNLKVDRSKGAPAPHKAILLLSVFQLIDAGLIDSNRVFITAELVARFKDNWHQLVKNEKFNPNFSLPFYHLHNDRGHIWNLKTLPGRELLLTSSNSIRSFNALKNCVEYAFFDKDLFGLLKNPVGRKVLTAILLETYLQGQTLSYYEENTIDVIEDQILNESTVEYRQTIENTDEEDLFVRGAVFKKVIPKEYNYTCCISGMKIISTREVQMIDACHIIPFSESHDDTIKNGISLSPNLHRAFDRFLVTINDKFEVVVSQDFMESGGFPIKAFHGKKIHLPREFKFYPSIENLNWHNERFYQLQNR